MGIYSILELNCVWVLTLQNKLDYKHAIYGKVIRKKYAKYTHWEFVERHFYLDYMS